MYSFSAACEVSHGKVLRISSRLSNPTFLICGYGQETSPMATHLLKSSLNASIAPTNVAILGDVVSFGNGQRIKIDKHQELHDGFLDSRISVSGCLIAHWFPPCPQGGF